MSIESIKSNAADLASTAADVTVKTATWAGNNVVWLTNQLLTKADSALRQTALLVREGWKRSDPFVRKTSAFLQTNTGMSCALLFTASVIYYNAEKISQLVNHEYASTAVNISLFALCFAAGYLFGLPPR